MLQKTSKRLPLFKELIAKSKEKKYQSSKATGAASAQKY